MRDDRLHGGREPAEAFVVAGLLRDRGEQVPEVGVSVSDPAAFVVVSEQCLHDREGDEFRVADPRGKADAGPPRGQVRMLFQVVVAGDVECCSEGVQIVVHSGSFGNRDCVCNLDPGHPRPVIPGDSPRLPLGINHLERMRLVVGEDLQPGEVLFTDDSLVNIEAARELGFVTHLFEGIDGLRGIVTELFDGVATPDGEARIELVENSSETSDARTSDVVVVDELDGASEVSAHGVSAELIDRAPDGSEYGVLER